MARSATTWCSRSRTWCRSGRARADQRDIVLYIPDRLLAYDRATGRGVVLSYDFSWKGKSTKGLPRDTAESVYAKTPRQGFADHAPGEYQATVEVARAAFARGDLFEAVPGQLFAEPCERSPAEVFRRLVAANPAPYGGLINLGGGEFLVAASPEMFVRGGAPGSRPARSRARRARRRRHRGRRSAPAADRLEKGRGGADHVHGCRPQRQGAHLRAGDDPGARAPPDRDLFGLFHTVDHVEGRSARGSPGSTPSSLHGR